MFIRWWRCIFKLLDLFWHLESDSLESDQCCIDCIWQQPDNHHHQNEIFFIRCVCLTVFAFHCSVIRFHTCPRLLWLSLAKGIPIVFFSSGKWRKHDKARVELSDRKANRFVSLVGDAGKSQWYWYCFMLALYFDLLNLITQSKSRCSGRCLTSKYIVFQFQQKQVSMPVDCP